MFNTGKPLIWFDLETTGADHIKDRVIEIAAKKTFADGRIETYYSKFNPQHPIEKEATEKHGLTNEMLANEPLFASKAKEILDFFQDADVAGYNIAKFDVPFLVEELLRCKLLWNVSDVKVYDAFRIWTHFESRTLTDAYKRFCNAELKNAHSANSDLDATMEISLAQLKVYGIDSIEKANELSLYDKEKTRVDLAGKITIVDGVETISFGKYAKQSFESVLRNDPSYIDWCSSNESFPRQSRIAFKLLKSKFEKQTATV